MIDIEKLKNRLADKEGVFLKPYICPAGKLTIGIGRNIEDNGLSLKEVNFLLENDIERCLKECRAQRWWSAVDGNDVRSRVAIEMCFNLGMKRLLGFKKMLLALEAKDYEKATHEMVDSAWARQVGKRAIELAEMMKTGKDQ